MKVPVPQGRLKISQDASPGWARLLVGRLNPTDGLFADVSFLMLLYDLFQHFLSEERRPFTFVWYPLPFALSHANTSASRRIDTISLSGRYHLPERAELS